MPLELDILSLTNEFRSDHALSPLRWHCALAGIARRHAVAVAEGRAPFSHAGAHQRFASCSTRCINVAENLARSDGFGRDDLPQAAVAGWRESTGHRRNLLGPFNACGVGWAASDAGTIFITQLLALLDERSSLRGQLREGALSVATSTPAICTGIGLVLAGPVMALGGGILGSALDYKYGMKVANVPSVLQKKFLGYYKGHACDQCGAPRVGELLVNGTDGKLLCARCHPDPSSADAWCFVE